jgi:uncharacterized membrane protein YdbT with pleckstrin-like domain
VSLPRKALGEGEEICYDLHPHKKMLVRPLLALIAVVFAASYAVFAIPPGGSASISRFLVLAAASVLLLWWAGWPFLRWQSTNFVLTNRRVVLRTGMFSRTGRDVPLHRVNDVAFTHGLLDRLLGCGTLTIESAGERGQLVLIDVPQVQVVQREIYRLIEEDDLRRRRSGDDVDNGADETAADRN